MGEGEKGKEEEDSIPGNALERSPCHPPFRIRAFFAYRVIAVGTKGRCKLHYIPPYSLALQSGRSRGASAEAAGDAIGQVELVPYIAQTNDCRTTREVGNDVRTRLQYRTYRSVAVSGF